MVPLYFRDPLTIPYVCAAGMMQAFTMIFGLYVTGIHPWDTYTLIYETLHLINQLAPWSYISIDTILPMAGIDTSPSVLNDKCSLPHLAFISLMALAFSSLSSN